MRRKMRSAGATRCLFIAAALLLANCALTGKRATLQSAVDAAYGEDGVRFRSALADLNNDAWPDAVVLVRNDDACGSGGCIFFVFKGTPDGFWLISTSTITQVPIRVLSSDHSGWKDLVVRSGGTGDVLLEFDGARYPSNPSLQPTPSSEQLQSARELIGRSIR